MFQLITIFDFVEQIQKGRGGFVGKFAFLNWVLRIRAATINGSARKRD